MFSVFFQQLPESEEISKISNQEEKIALLESLMSRYDTEILRLAYSYMKRREVAEDIAQEVFIKCYEKTKQGRQWKRLPCLE